MNDLTNDPTPFPSRLMHLAALVTRGLSWVLLAVLLLLAMAWGALHVFIVPRIGEFRPRLETMASDALGVPVRIGALEAGSTGMVPSFELREVALLDAAGREALRLPRVQVALTALSLLDLGFEQIFVDAPELDIRRTANGRVLLAGLDLLSGDATQDSAAADWFFSQREFVIRGGTVRWTDEQRGAPPLALAAVDLVIRNHGHRHDLRLDATPPAGWGEPFVLMGQFRRGLLSRHPGRWRDWGGQLYADFTRVDVSQLHRYAQPGLDVSEGNGALRLWADIQAGQFVGGTADVALAEVTATLGPKLEPLALRSVAGRLGGKWLAGGFQFFTEGLQFQTREGQHWPGGNVFLSYLYAEGRKPASGELRADRLDLAALSQVAHRLPLGDAAHKLLREHPIQGLVQTVQARWQGAMAAPESYQARGRVSGLAIGARPAALPMVPGVPGVRGATVDFDLSQTGGHANLAIAGGALEFPGVFEDPVLAFDRFEADLTWKVEGERIAVPKVSIKLANADAEGEFRGSWQTSDPGRSSNRSRFPGVLDLQGSFSRADGARVHRYLPLGIPADVRHYVRDAVQRGKASGVAVRVKGDLNDVPFASARQGEFRFAGKVRDVTLAYVPRSLQKPDEPPWPALSELAGELVFDRNSMQVNGAQTRVAGLPGLQFTRVEARIPDLAHNTTVQVSAEGKGPAAQVLGVVNGSPLSALLDGALAKARASGDTSFKLGLDLPIASIAKSRVQGSVTLAGNELQISPDTPAMARVRGVVGFSESGFSVTGGQARMLGGDLKLEGGTRPAARGVEAAVVLRAQGSASAEGLRQAGELGVISRLAQGASGSTSYSGVLTFRRGQSELALSSNLQGLALALPPPLSKSADAVLPLRYEQALVAESLAGGGLRDQITLELGRLLSASYVRDLSAAQPRLLRGAIGVGLAAGESVPLPAQGVAANVNMAQLNADAWNELLNRPAAAATPAAAAPPAGSDAMQDYLPTVFALRAGELTMGGRKLQNLVVGGTREGSLWRVNLDARQLSGYAEYRQSSEAGPGRVYARLARLVIAPSAASEVESLLDQQPSTIPALDIVVEDLDLRGKRLGRVEVEAVSRGAAATAAGGGREWRLNKLNLVVPEASLTASGSWAAAQRGTGERRRMTLDFRLDLADSGALFDRLGMKDVIRRGRGRVEGQVAWVGSPLAIDYPSLGGQFHVNAENGQFLKADPGLAKLLGVLSLQSLPRRLTLDFRDVFSEGFAFDFIRGDVAIAQGVASTNNLQMKGVNAVVLMDGRADIAKETQDLRVVVVPEIDAGTASLVASVINPAVGLGSFLAQLFLRRPLVQANTQEFHIDGTWTDPRVTKVEGKPVPPAAGASEPRPGVQQ